MYCRARNWFGEVPLKKLWYLETDVIAMTTDGASVMVKIGKIVPCFQLIMFCTWHSVSSC